MLAISGKTLALNNNHFSIFCSDNFFIYIHHGGQFHTLLDGDKIYSGGELTTRHFFDKDKFGYLDLEDEVEKLGYTSWSSLSFKVPKSNVYKVLHDDKDVLDMLIFLSNKCNFIAIYVDNGKKSGYVTGIVGDIACASINVTEKTNASMEASEVAELTKNAPELHMDFEDHNSDEDTDYKPVGESETDDSMSDEDLASEDDEYIQARWNKRNIKATRERGVLSTQVQLGITRMSTGELTKVVDDGFMSEYDESEGEVNSESSEDEDFFDDQGYIRRKRRKVTYDPKCDHKLLKLVLGMRFEDGFQCKRAVQKHAIENGHPIHFRRCNKEQCEAYCSLECGWRLYASVVRIDGTFSIKSLSGDHKCPRAMNNKQVSSSWIANEYLNKFRVNPNWSVKELEADIMERFACQVTKWRLYDAKFKALMQLRGSVREHYGKLRSYIAELMRVDKDGSTYVESYKIALEDLKSENEAAYTNFLERDPQKFCKAFISTTPVCDMIDNNISETFNSFIVVARMKHVYDMLEDIKNALMKRQFNKLEDISGASDNIYPNIRAKIEKMKYDSREDYSMKNYVETYKFGIEPCNGPKMWPDTSGEPVQPPLVRRMPGRQKKKRRKALEEKEDAKSIKFPMQMTCRRCQQPGHNIRTCKQETVVKPPTVNVNKGYGVCTFEDSGRIYARMPSEKRIHFVNPSRWKTGSNTTWVGKKGQTKHDKETSSSSDKVVELETQDSRS
ncbi:hypothetical protein C2S52_008369 [Perilla frutescens var. hirtella]|nr:hypothetical protein C2S52_008369 [Perilla frutescens var. hirtella]